eukprot:1235055-Rhodomonas_salina.1
MPARTVVFTQLDKPDNQGGGHRWCRTDEFWQVVICHTQRLAARVWVARDSRVCAEMLVCACAGRSRLTQWRVSCRADGGARWAAGHGRPGLCGLRPDALCGWREEPRPR